MEKKLTSLLVTRNAEGTMYYVCDPTTGGKKMAVCGTRFLEGKEPDSLVGSIIALCSAAGEDPLITAVRLGEYIIDDDELTKKIKDFVLATFEDAVGGDFFKDEEEPEPEPIEDEDEDSVKEFIDYIKEIFE